MSPGEDTGSRQAQQLLMLQGDWGFRLEDVAFGPVRMWHDTRDWRVPIAAARDMAGRLEHATVVEHDGGIGLNGNLLRDRVFPELAWMMGARPSPMPSPPPGPKSASPTPTPTFRPRSASPVMLTPKRKK